jgi:hypothetical protein
MEVGIEAGDRVDLTHGDTDSGSKRLELVGWQVPEVSLYRPQFVKHDSRRSARGM